MTKKELLAKDILELESMKANMLVENENVRIGNEKVVALKEENEVKLLKGERDLKKLNDNTAVAKRDNKVWNQRIDDLRTKLDGKNVEIQELKEKASFLFFFKVFLG